MPAAWYRVAASRSLRPGHLLRFDLPGRSYVVWRGREDRQPHAVAAHCAHMGTHLAHGAVVGDRLRCPLHHWCWAASGSGERASGDSVALRQPTFAVAEAYGSLWLYPTGDPPPPLPALASLPDATSFTLAGRPLTLRCPWPAVAANGFDFEHLATEHGRTPITAPTIELADRQRLRLRYAARVTGQGLADRAVRWLSANHVALDVSCWSGTLISVESRLGHRRLPNGLFLCLRPLNPKAVEVTPLFVTPRGRLPAWSRLRLRVVRSLFQAFVRKDAAFMDDLDFHPSPLAVGDRVAGDRVAGDRVAGDPVLAAMLAFLASIPGLAPTDP